MTPDPGAAVASAFQREWARVVAALIRLTGDWDLAEECAQDAFAAALRCWGRDGVPRRPGAWLTTVARNRAYDRLRRAATEAERIREVAVLNGRTDTHDTADPDGVIRDDRLRLMFACCHPALPIEARVALTLRTVAGLTTAEVARAFLVPEATMAKRLVRAKQKIANAGIPFRVPPSHLLHERTDGVLAVLCLLFNEGYAASGGEGLAREGLCVEAIRLARAVAELLPDDPEPAGLLALMLLQHSRRRARVDADGNLVTLEEQDRADWDHAEIDEATRLLRRSLRGARVGPFQLQAAIAACHAEPAEASATDWLQIVALYDRLVEIMPSPVVELNRAVAVAMADGPAAGLALVEALDGSGRLGRYHLLHAIRADLLRRLGRGDDAAASYRRALELTSNATERRFITRRLAQVA